MGYTTDFEGSVSVEPPLNGAEIRYLTKFCETRRMHREKGPYFVDGSGPFGQGGDPDIIEFNAPGPEQPELWCKWKPVEDGSAIEWDGMEKFYGSVEWMAYLIDTFLKPDATLHQELNNPVPDREYPEAFDLFTFDHVVNGVIDAQGEDADDRWRLVVKDNVVAVKRARVLFEDED